MQKQQSSGGAGPHVAILTYPFGSHAPPLFAVTRGLASAAPNALFSFLFPGKCNSLATSQQVPSNIKVYNVWDGAPEGNGMKDIESFMRVELAVFKKGVEVAVAETGRKLSCLVSDAFVRVGKEIAEENGVAWVTFFASGAASLSSHVYTDLIRQHYGTAAGEDETLNFIPGMSNVRIRDLPEGIVTGDLQSGFCRMLHEMSKELHQATAVFINSCEELHPTITDDMKSKFKKLLSVGPLVFSTPPATVPDSHGCLPWLDKQKPATVAYIAFGAAVIPPPNELVALAEALEASRLPFIWSLRDKGKEHLPSGFVDSANGMVVPWAPQMDVLSHGAVGVFISHGGFASMLETIASEVPMIVRPFFGDHMINGRMVEAVWEIGVVVKGGIFTKNDIMNCLDMALAQENGRKWRKNLKAIKEMALTAVGPQGSSAKNFKALLDLVSSY
ncbi:UDP-glucosyl transferase 78D3 [Hibiscus trionum]|uniref:Glycosyltransferase n=1 Tax=Hibiscus trionum TaxID=183268 RepID=A0A9W7HUH8_HIBTR|nr:UDP-glucosyl transferase 78D3 [Hibiscus trionum]